MIQSLALSVAALSEHLHYDPVTGKFTWRIRKPGRREIKSAISQIMIDGVGYKPGRLAWALQTGAWPRGVIDHINGVRTDHRFENLRDVTQQENVQNLKGAKKSNKTSNRLGVYPNAGRWSSKISTNGRQIYLGIFDTIDQAHAAYIQAKRRLHKGCTV
jgi:hypothetical protein